MDFPLEEEKFSVPFSGAWKTKFYRQKSSCMEIRKRSRIFVRVGHGTKYASSEKKNTCSLSQVSVRIIEITNNFLHRSKSSDFQSHEVVLICIF